MRRDISLIIFLGLCLGIFTSLGQTYIPGPFNQLANSYSLWLLVAFVSGIYLSSYRKALISGALIQYIALLTYYVLIELRFSSSGFSLSSNFIWLAGGTIVGPISAICGRTYMYRSKYAIYGLSFIVAVILSEALYLFLQLHYVAEGVVFTLWACIVLGALLWNLNRRLRVLLPIIILTAVFYAGYAYVLTAIFN